VIELDIRAADQLARDIAGYGADALVLEPQSLRDDVLARLRAHAGMDAVAAGQPPSRGGVPT
jgi:proteasome accessory factor B